MIDRHNYNIHPITFPIQVETVSGDIRTLQVFLCTDRHSDNTHPITFYNQVETVSGEIRTLQVAGGKLEPQPQITAIVSECPGIIQILPNCYKNHNKMIK